MPRSLILVKIPILCYTIYMFERKPESTKKEHVGAGTPYEELRQQSQLLAQQAAKVEEQIKEARKAKDELKVQSLEIEHRELMDQQRKAAEHAATLRKHEFKPVENPEK